MLVVTNISTYLGGTAGSRAGHAIFRDGTQLTHDPYAAFRDGGTYKNAKTTQAFLDTGISDTNNHTYSLEHERRVAQVMIIGFKRLKMVFQHLNLCTLWR